MTDQNSTDAAAESVATSASAAASPVQPGPAPSAPAEGDEAQSVSPATVAAEVAEVPNVSAVAPSVPATEIAVVQPVKAKKVAKKDADKSSDDERAEDGEAEVVALTMDQADLIPGLQLADLGSASYYQASNEADDDDDGSGVAPIIAVAAGGLVVGGLAIALGGGKDDDVANTPPNRNPTAGADTASATEGGAAVTGSVASNDSDPDGDPLTYTLTGTAPAGLTFNNNGTFSFDPASAAYNSLAAGQTQQVVANYSVSDGKGGSATSTLTITVTGTNDAPVAVADTNTATEGGAAVTGSVATNDTDVDQNSTLTYALNAPVAGLTLNANGTYSFDPTDPAYDRLSAGQTTQVVANYTVSDGQGGTSTSTLTITVTGTNDAPVITSGATASVDENAAVSTVVYDASATDADGDAVTYSLTGADAALFTIDAMTGEVRLTAPANFEADATYNITVVATDAGGLSDSQDVTVTVNDVNEAPVVTSGATASVDENAATATVVYDAAATDPDGDTLVYSLSGPDAALFTIDPATGEVRLVSSADFEADASYSITVTATDPDGLADSQDVTVTVNDVNEAPVVTSGATASVDENAATATVVYDAAATDPDGDTLVYSLSGPDAALFTIDPATGEVRLVSSADFEADASYSITVTATDPDGLADSQDVTVTVNDVNEVAVITGENTGSVEEDGTLTASGTLVVSDPDAGQDALQPTTGGTYGTFVVNADGTWTYTLNNEDPAVQALQDGESLTDSIVVTSEDGTASETITVTIAGANDLILLDIEDLDNVVPGDPSAGDGNPATPDAEDAGGGDFVYVDDAAQPNNTVISNFGENQNDFILTDALDGDYEFLNLGNGDLQLTFNSPGGVNVIVLEDVLAPDAGRITTEAQAETALGYDFFRDAEEEDPVANPGGVDPDPEPDPDPTLSTLDLEDTDSVANGGDGNPATANVVDAAGGDFIFEDDSAQPNSTIIQNFGENDGDFIVTDAEDGDYEFLNLGDGDLQITFNSPGGVNVIVLEDVISPDAGRITTEAQAEAAVGYDFFRDASEPAPGNNALTSIETFVL